MRPPQAFSGSVHYLVTEDNEGNDRLLKITSRKACKAVFRSVFLSHRLRLLTYIKKV